MQKPDVATRLKEVPINFIVNIKGRLYLDSNAKTKTHVRLQRDFVSIFPPLLALVNFDQNMTEFLTLVH